MPPGEVGPGWSQEGVASWYGDPFHGRRTASGEVYNMDAPTAAHPGLPFGTLIRVENLDNGRSTVLRVNDRGPFARGRILDVSRHGARELGMIGPGTARVRVVVEEVPRPRDCWDVQVGSFRDAGNAEEVRRRLAGEGWPVRVDEGPGGIRRVVSGPLVRVEARELTGRHGGLMMGCAGGGGEGGAGAGTGAEAGVDAGAGAGGESGAGLGPALGSGSGRRILV